MTQQYNPNNINNPTGVRFVNADTALTFDDGVVIIDGGAPTLTLPNAAQIPGISIFVKSVSGSGSLIGASGQTIDGASSFPFLQVNHGVILESNGASWAIASNTMSSGSGASGQHRISYGSVVGVFISGIASPLNVPSLVDTARKRGDFDLINYFTSYTRCLWDVYVASGNGSNVIHEGLTFATLDEMVDWANANLTTAGGFFDQSATFHAYDLVDESIPEIDRCMARTPSCLGCAEVASIGVRG